MLLIHGVFSTDQAQSLAASQSSPPCTHAWACGPRAESDIDPCCIFSGILGSHSVTQNIFHFSSVLQVNHIFYRYALSFFVFVHIIDVNTASTGLRTEAEDFPKSLYSVCHWSSLKTALVSMGTQTLPSILTSSSYFPAFTKSILWENLSAVSVKSRPLGLLCLPEQSNDITKKRGDFDIWGKGYHN